MKPILFNPKMVRAILNGRKTVTRRVVKPQPFDVKQDKNAQCWCGHFVSESGKVLVDKPPYRPGDILYVRETWYYETFYENTDNAPDLTSGRRSWRYVYKADNPDYPVVPGHWRPSIHMPREAARIFLRVTDVRVERLQEITDDDIAKEGVQSKKGEWLRIDFADLWNSTIKKADLAPHGWEANPWVWVIEFERISREEAEGNARPA